MKLLYKPVAILCGTLAGLVSKRLAARIWALVDDRDPPSPTTDRASWSRVLGAAAIQGVTFSVTRAAVDRAGAKGFARLFGVWPGEQEGEGSGEDEAA
jgi:pectin methylesterase-like acyl-CoA thioesterase